REWDPTLAWNQCRALPEDECNGDISPTDRQSGGPTSLGHASIIDETRWMRQEIKEMGNEEE
ncbi:MAG: hypothetical protein WAK29_02620, partial [Terriglobales bacterium]